MVNKFKYILLFLLLSCNSQENSLSSGLVEGVDWPAKSGIDLSMSDNLELTISIKDFNNPIAIISFNLIYDHAVLKVSSYSGGELGAPFFANMDEMDLDNDSTQCGFVFSGNFQNDGTKTLLKVNFSQKSTYNGTTVFLSDILMADANGSEVIFDYNENYWSESVCYLSEHPTNGDILFGGDYRWANSFCWPLNY